MRAPREKDSLAPLANDPICRRQNELESLASVHRSWGLPENELIGWLLDQGVSEQAMMHPWCIGGARVRFEGRHFDVNLDGELAITFRAEDCEEVIDLTAWQPRTGKLASWREQAFCIGDFDDLFNPAIYFAGGALRIHASPLEWLRANREGIVILRPDLAYAHLRFVPRLSFADPTHARRVQSWIRAPQACAELFIETSAEMVK